MFLNNTNDKKNAQYNIKYKKIGYKTTYTV